MRFLFKVFYLNVLYNKMEVLTNDDLNKMRKEFRKEINEQKYGIDIIGVKMTYDYKINKLWLSKLISRKQYKYCIKSIKKYTDNQLKYGSDHENCLETDIERIDDEQEYIYQQEQDQLELGVIDFDN